MRLSYKSKPLTFLAPKHCKGVDDNCCTAENPCGEGDGDCDNDDECLGPLVCGIHNCPWGDGDDCCRRFDWKGRLLGYFYKNDII